MELWCLADRSKGRICGRRKARDVRKCTLFYLQGPNNSEVRHYWSRRSSWIGSWPCFACLGAAYLMGGISCVCKILLRRSIPPHCLFECVKSAHPRNRGKVFHLVWAQFLVWTELGTRPRILILFKRRALSVVCIGHLKFTALLEQLLTSRGVGFEKRRKGLSKWNLGCISIFYTSCMLRLHPKKRQIQRLLPDFV